MKQTPLFAKHLDMGAKMLDFAGWNMPLHYSSIQQEHIAVRTSVGLFDVSHMAELRISGTGSTEFLRYSTLNDPAKLRLGRGQYSMLPNNQGGLIDDIYLYRETEDTYLMVCNAANRDKAIKHLNQLANNYEVTLTDETESWTLLALQGPGAVLLLTRLTNHDLSSLKKNSKVTARVNTHSVHIARTGYSGEDGFEIFCRPDDASFLWDDFISAGATACGLGARDTLRLEAGFPLYGQEFSETTNPLCTDYAWVVKDKAFYGRDAMWDKPCPKKLVGIRLAERGIARHGYNIFSHDTLIGEISSGTISPLTRESIAMGWINKDYSDLGTEILVEIRGQKRSAVISQPPFYTP